MNTLERIKAWAEKRIPMDSIDDSALAAFRLGQMYAKLQLQDLIAECEGAGEKKYEISAVALEPCKTSYILVERGTRECVKSSYSLDLIKAYCWEQGLSKDDIVIL